MSRSNQDNNNDNPQQSQSTTASLRRTPKAQDGDNLGNASSISSIANLTNTIIGTGMLATPHAFAYCGLLLGVLLILFCGVTASFGLYLLTRSAAKVGGRDSSFFKITNRTIPWAARWFDAAIALKCYGVSISYLIICGQVMPQVILSFFKAFHKDIHEIPTFLLDRQFWILILMIVLIPLCFLRRLDSLRHTSYLSLLAVLFLVLTVIYYSLFPSARKELPKHSKGSIEFIRLDYHLIAIFPVFVFAYTCAQNVFPVYNELKDNSEKEVNKVILRSISGGGTIYLIVGILGYLTFGNKTPDNIITNYPSNSLFVCIARVSIVILTLFSYPLQVHPCRASIDKIFTSRSNEEETEAFNQDSESLLNEEEILADEEEVGNEQRNENENEDGIGMRNNENGTSNESRSRIPRRIRRKNVEMPLWKWCTITCFLLVTTFILSIVIEDLSLILGFVGSIGSTTISFILPGILYSVLHRDEVDNKLVKWAKVLTAWGVLVMVTALSANIWKLTSGGKLGD